MPSIRDALGHGGDGFDDAGEFVPDHLPDPGPFLDDHDVLTGAAHVAVHETARECFEERGVYDVTFDYNLARLNLDARHPDAGYRYAEETDDPAVLRAEFTPTTPFCPQSRALAVGSFRAWNGLADRHDYDCVRVRVHPMHHAAEEINDRLAALESTFRETGEVTGADEDTAGRGEDAGGPRLPF
ncbi:MAG: hypothetical protein ABEJ82_07700 [Haloplanus sp.]